MSQNFTSLSTGLFIGVAYPHCATCCDRCYPGGAALIMDAKNLYDGISRLLAASSARELPKPVNDKKAKSVAENGELPAIQNGETPDAKESEAINAEEGNKSPTSQTDQADTNIEKVLD